MQNPKKPLPETTEEAIQLAQWRAWLGHPITKLFFAQLEQDRIDALTKASIIANKTGSANAVEHNKLVEARAYLKIKETYDNGTTYPITLRRSTGPSYPTPAPETGG